MPRVAAILVNLVPYHHARWEAYARFSGNECHVVELTNRDGFKVLELPESSTIYHRYSLFPLEQDETMSPAVLRWRMALQLEKIRPEVVCVTGWGLSVSLVAIDWAVRNRVPLLLLSESNSFDERRSAFKEYVKRFVVGYCSTGLAGGTPQRDYLLKLGMSPKRVFLGYDVVDNDYFRSEVAKARLRECELRSFLKLPSRYFLSCARFGKKKNLPGLISAYARFRDKVAQRDIPHLLIVGEGEERATIEEMVRERNLHESVHLVGQKSYQEMPLYYALAETFIHASTTEQWGLVVNEAMASGLPVLVSMRCGCAADLVEEGVNGFSFDPHDEEQIAGLMAKISRDHQERSAMGLKSQEIIANWSLPRFVQVLTAAISLALDTKKPTGGYLERMILRLISLR